MSNDQAGVRNRAIADRKIETLLDKIDHSAGCSETDRHVRIELVEFRYRWSDQAGYRRGCIEAQHATGGTGNVEATHYDANGRFVRDSVSQNPTIPRDQ